MKSYRQRLAWALCGVALLTLATGLADEEAPLAGWHFASIPIKDTDAMRKAGHKFMKDLCNDEYEQAFRELTSRYGQKDGQAVEKGAQLAQALRRGKPEINSDLGEPIPGEFTFVGSRSLGGRLYKLVYLRRHQHGPFPLVLVFTRPENTWQISQFALGPAHAEADLKSFLVYSEPMELAEMTPKSVEIVKSTDACMKLLTEGKSLKGLEVVANRYSGSVPKDKVAAFTRSLTKHIDGRPEKIGSPKSYELVAASRLSNDLFILTYEWSFDHSRTAISFVFYRLKESWSLHTIRVFDDAMPDLLAATVTNRAKLDEAEGAADQPATAPESMPEDEENPKPKSEVRPQ